jgi:hypothetical protein
MPPGVVGVLKTRTSSTPQVSKVAKASSGVPKASRDATTWMKLSLSPGDAMGVPMHGF